MKFIQKVKTASATEHVPQRRRAWEIDLIRGLCILYVTVYHFAFITAEIIEMNTPFGIRVGEFCSDLLYAKGSFFETIHYPIVYVLFFISGVSKQFTRNDLLRFRKVAVAALLITAVMETAGLLLPQLLGLQIRFGVLHSIASAMLLFWAMEKAADALSKNNHKTRVIFNALFAIIGAAAILIGTVYMDNETASPPKWLFFLVTSPTGYKMSPGDFFPILPYGGYYIFGALAGKFVYADKTGLFSAQCPLCLKPFCWCGRYSLQIYFAGPVLSGLILGVLSVLGWI